MCVRLSRPGRAELVFVLCTLVTAAGCQSETPLPEGIPKGASLLGEAVGPIGERDVDHEPPWEVEADGMLYLRNVNSGKLVSGPVRAGQMIRLYPGWVSVAGAQVDRVTGQPLPQRFVKERIVARFKPGNRYQIYYRPGLSEQELAKAKAGPATQPGQQALVPLDPVPVFRRRDAGSVERPRDEVTPIRPPPQREEPPVLVPLPR
jgi:hypothetical protein